MSENVYCGKCRFIKYADYKNHVCHATVERYYNDLFNGKERVVYSKCAEVNRYNDCKKFKKANWFILFLRRFE